MSEAMAGEEGREEIEHRLDLGNGSVTVKRDSSDAGGKRDSDASSGSEGSQQRQTQAQSGQAQGHGSRTQQSQGQFVDDVGEKEVDKNQVKRHVEASPQGRYLRFEDKLGTGQYKVVYRSYDTSMGIEVAWNTVNIKNLPKEEKKRIMNEVRLLQNLEHKNLVQFHGSWVNREKEEVIFVTEIMQSGSLMDFIRKVEMIRWRVVKRWARQILRGMNYLHSQDPPIIHRDLKCDNIFINGAAGDIRIGDLGLSTSNTRSEKTMSVLGTPEFMAPELYEESYTEKVDIYAFGMCMLEMVTKERPYSECVNAAQIYRKVTSQILPSALDRVQNARAREFIRVCLSPDPDERPSAMDLLNLPFLKDKNEEEDNTLVMLAPEGAGQVADTGSSSGVSPGVGVNAPAKIDPSLPGVSHPSVRGTPALDTIEEASTIPGGAQVPTPTASVSQGQTGDPLVAVSSAGHSDPGSSAQSESAEGSADAPSRRPSYAMALMSDSVGSEIGEVGNDTSTSSEAGVTDINSGKGADVAAQPGAGVKGEGGEPYVDGDGALYGVHKIPGNAPPFESDDDEDEQENDVSHPEGFLRAMPEDESAMRVLKLPDGRVRRAEDDDYDEDEAASQEDSLSDDMGVAPTFTAPSSAQAPPLSSAPPPAPAEITPPAAVAPLRPAASAPPAVQAPRPPIADSAVFLSGGGRRGGRVGSVDGGGFGAMGMRGVSTPGYMSPMGVPMSRSGNPTNSTFHAVSGGMINEATNMSMAALVSDPGFMSPPVGPAVRLQRARSFSPLEQLLPDTLNAVAGPPVVPAPTCPAPTFRAPHPPGHSSGDFVEQNAKGHNVSHPEVLGTGNGWGPGLHVMHEEVEKPLFAQQADQELQELLSGRAVGSGGFQTEIKIANLQGPEQEIMRLVMHTRIEGRLQEVEFDFNLDDDHPKQVSGEMIRELGLSDEELGPISLTITNLAEKARKRRVRRASSTSSVTVSQAYDAAPAVNLPWSGSDTNLAAAVAYRGSQALGGTASFGSGGGDAPISGGSEGADHDALGCLPGGVEMVWSDDDLDIEDDDEFRKRKLLHDKKKRQAEKVYEARLAALLAARNDRTDEHKRAQERYKKDCDDFDKKVEKLQSEKERRMEECLDELRGLEDGYRQKHRDAKQAKRHSAAAGSIALQVGMMAVSQPPLEAAPTPQGYAQLQAMGHGQGQNNASSVSVSEGVPHSNHVHGQPLMDAGAEDTQVSPDLQHLNLSQYNSIDGQVVGASQWNSNSHDVAAAAAISVHQQQQQQQQQQQGINALTAEEEESARRDRLSTL